MNIILLVFYYYFLFRIDLIHLLIGYRTLLLLIPYLI